MRKVKIKLFILMVATALASCHDSVNIDAEKLLIIQKMRQKVNAVTKDLKDYCDSEIYRKAKLVADSILIKRRREMEK